MNSKRCKLNLIQPRICRIPLRVESLGKLQDSSRNFQESSNKEIHECNRIIHSIVHLYSNVLPIIFVQRIYLDLTWSDCLSFNTDFYFHTETWWSWSFCLLVRDIWSPCANSFYIMPLMSISHTLENWVQN